MAEPKATFHDALAGTLLANLSAFHAFARSRLGDEQLAADAVQESLLRALRSEHQLTDDENLLAWLYRILRNVLTDLHRRRATQKAALENFTVELETAGAGRELEATACRCLAGLLPTLRPEYAETVRRLDLDGQEPEEAARTLGITRNNLKVRLHRARKQLRERLEQTCRACARHGCLNCTCDIQN